MIEVFGFMTGFAQGALYFVAFTLWIFIGKKLRIQKKGPRAHKILKGILLILLIAALVFACAETIVFVGRLSESPERFVKGYALGQFLGVLLFIVIHRWRQKVKKTANSEGPST